MHIIICTNIIFIYVHDVLQALQKQVIYTIIIVYCWKLGNFTLGYAINYLTVSAYCIKRIL